MNYVINLEDGGGKEFFLSADGKLIGLTDPGNEQPQEFKILRQALKKREELRPKYPPICRIYALEIGEFNNRRQILQKT
ncbi:hypothetical protein GO755_27865 [Spirosoma sp. HMF4905]|uniref:Uncharacterized protein n=1 Tax=Spirosoma arboris TaxID=2682092 RepID=A0A7K1SJD4_9BACT|nr:hypothetical protein [Spirosoma arboris]MVM33885.1 hypothetical protein [Spirosoma arboris]